MQATKIEWTDMSWNPVTGCKHGCPYCYARRIYDRFGRSFEPAFHPDRLGQPLKRRKPSKIFVCSVADLFGSWVPKRWIDDVLEVVRQCPRHTFQFLTKDPRRLPEQNWPANAWVGVTINQPRDVERLVPLMRCDARVRFASVEPMHGPVRMNGISRHVPEWVIIGAQTGPGGLQPERRWVEDLTADARRAGAAVFYKPNLLEWPNPPREFPTPRAVNILVSMSEEELQKVPQLSDEEISEALRKGREERDAFEANARPVPTNSKILFR